MKNLLQLHFYAEKEGKNMRACGSIFCVVLWPFILCFVRVS